MPDLSDSISSTDSSSSQSYQRSRLNDSLKMISNGGLGRASNPTYTPSQRNAGHKSDLHEALDTYDKQFLPSQPRSLAGIALRAFLLGTSLTASLITSIYLLILHQTPFWRAPFFISALSLFHFLEFYSTAYANTPDASVSSYLLSSNGPAYTIAHTVALTECLLSHAIRPTPFLTPLPHYLLLTLGLLLLVLGQTVRTAAMITAGRSFSHIVAHTKRSSHTLITTGPYHYLRHPSYFGFFWWGIGTQLVCGNTVALAGYAVVLWYFFWKRIRGEEESLVRFFGDEYVVYRERTRIGIPFI